MSDKGQLYVERFVFQNRPPGHDQGAEWMVVIGEVHVDTGGQIHILPTHLSMAQAIAKGFALPEIGSAINTATLTELEDVRAERDSLKANLTQAIGELEVATAQAAQMIDAHELHVAAISAERDGHAATSGKAAERILHLTMERDRLVLDMGGIRRQLEEAIRAAEKAEAALAEHTARGAAEPTSESTAA